MTEAQTRYQAYLKSDHWKKLRLNCLVRDGHKCTRCASVSNLEVHHVRYRHPWEMGVLGDVIVLCGECHGAEHGLSPKPPKPTPVDKRRKKMSPSSARYQKAQAEGRAKTPKWLKRWKQKQQNVSARIKRLGGYPDSWKFKKRKSTKSIWRTGSNPGY